ncbi:MAG: Flp family type IVb pilin [Erythrobacter cryptus]
MVPRFIRDLSDDTSGATAIEYSLIIALIAMAALLAIQSVAGTTIAMWTEVASRVVSAISGS